MFRGKSAKQLLDTEVINLTKQGKCLEVLSIIKDHPPKKLFDGDGNHPLHLAAKYNNTELIKCLIQLGCKITAKNASRMTPLMIAVVHKNFEAARILHEAQVEFLHKRSAAAISDDSWSNSKEAWRTKSEILLHNDLVSKMRKERLSSELIGETLAKVTNCLPIDVCYYRDPVMTKAYLQSATTRLNTAMIMRTCVKAIDRHDWQHSLLMFDNAPCKRDNFFAWLCSYMLNKIADFRKSKSGRQFLKRYFSLEMFKENDLKCLEKEFFYERIYNVKMLYDFHAIVKAKYGRDIFASLWGNGHVYYTVSGVTSLLKDDQIDVDGRGYNGKTPLHFAAKSGCLINNVQLLLERGADPNACDEKQRTPLGLAIFTRLDNTDEMCIKMLLLAGANPLLISSDHFDDMPLSGRHLTIFQRRASIKQLVFAQLIIYETLGQSIEKSVDVFEPWCNQDLEKFMEECREQLNGLKKNKIRETCGLSMFAILAERPEKIARFLSKEDVQTIFRFAECNGKTLISYYVDLLKKRAEDIVQINCYRQRAVDVVCQFTGISDPHHLVVNKIVDYFSAKDLQKFSVTESQNLSLRAKASDLFKLTKKCIFKL